MRKLIAWNLMTLDGKFEGTAPWSLDFHETVWGDELEAFSVEQSEEVGTLLFGHRTHDGMAAYWATQTGQIADFMNSVDKVLVSRGHPEPRWTNSRVLEGGVPDGIASLKAERGKDIFVFGSADLLSSLLDHDLVDEYRLCLVPRLLGRGTPLFKPSDRATGMTLLETRPLGSGGVILRYGIDHPE